MLKQLLRQIFAKSETAPALGKLAARAGEAMNRRDHACAARIYEQLLRAHPANADAWGRLGFCQAALGRHEQAATSFRALARLNPDSREAHANLGHLALLHMRLSEAVRHYRTALACGASDAMQDAALNTSLGFALLRQGEPEQAIAHLRKALQEQPRNIEAATHLLFALQHAPSTGPQDLYSAFCRWSDVHERPLLPLHRPHDNRPEPGRPLRLGYVSGDFASHAVSNFIEPLLAHHDRSGFEVHCYANRGSADDQTRGLQALADRWCDIFALSDEAAAERIRADGIDILVDLSGHTHGNRLLVFARKPAPVQMTYLGYPTTTGLRSIDYRITDAAADPPGLADRYHSERLLRLPRSQWCYRPKPAAPAVSALPAQRKGRIMFGSFNKLAKLNDSVLALWSQVLTAVPKSAMTIVTTIDPPNCERIAAKLVAHGAAPERVRVLGAVDDAEFWRIREEIDIVLDSHPYNGTTTTCEALWAGLPVVSLAGPYGASRNSASLLQAVGLAHMAASDARSFVAIAKDLAGNIAHLAKLRSEMRQRLIDHGLCDGPRFTRELEALYRQAWQAWCRQPSNKSPRQ